MQDENCISIMRNYIIPGGEKNCNLVQTFSMDLSQLSGSALTIPYGETTREPGYTTLLIHKLRNRLTSIDLAAEMLAGDIKEERSKIYLYTIQQNSGIINNLVNELLKTHEPAGFSAKKHSALQLLENVLTMLEKRIVGNNIVVKKEFGEPDTGFVMNETRIMIALNSIIVNALEAMSPGTGELTLVTKTSAEGYVIEIRDNGCGMNRETLEKLFMPFFTTKNGALGLGLATAAEILFHNHVGIKVTSQEGEGTSFFLLFEYVNETADLFSGNGDGRDCHKKDTLSMKFLPINTDGSSIV